jgi:hypothetical protein
MALASITTHIGAKAESPGAICFMRRAGATMQSSKIASTLAGALVFGLGGAGVFWLGAHVLLWWLI